MLEEAREQIRDLLDLMREFPTNSQWLQGYEAGKLAILQWVIGRLENQNE